MKLFIELALLCASVAWCNVAFAVMTCQVPSGVAMNFGTYDDSLAADRQFSTTFTVQCCRTGGAASLPYTVSMGPSTQSTAGNKISTRMMKNSANSDRMNYQLYYGSFGGTLWGDGTTGSTYTLNVTANTRCAVGWQTFTVGSAIFGVIPMQQAVSAGTYADTVTISITP